MKICTKCEEIKTADSFYKGRNHCKTCVLLQNKEYSRRYKNDINFRIRNREERKKRKEKEIKVEDKSVTISTSLFRWRKNNPEKVRANRLVFVAKRNGTLKNKSCFCGKEKSEAHHHDYSKPNEIYWLCKEHHKEADIARQNDLPFPFTEEIKDPEIFSIKRSHVFIVKDKSNIKIKARKKRIDWEEMKRELGLI